MSFNNYLGGLGVQVQQNMPRNQQQIMAAYALQQQQQQFLLQQQAAAHAQAQGQPINPAVLQQQYQQLYGANFNQNTQQILLAQQQQQQQQLQQQQLQMQRLQANHPGLHPQQIQQMYQLSASQTQPVAMQVPTPGQSDPAQPTDPTQVAQLQGVQGPEMSQDALQEIEKLKQFSSEQNLDGWKQEKEGDVAPVEWDKIGVEGEETVLGKRQTPEETAGAEDIQTNEHPIEASNEAQVLGGEEPMKVKFKLILDSQRTRVSTG
jgi:ribosomal protein L24